MIKRDIVHKDLVNKMDMYRLTITSSHKRQQRSNEIVFHENHIIKLVVTKNSIKYLISLVVL